jgi:hypothetical protein
MIRRLGIGGLLALGLSLMLAGSARADRTPSYRVPTNIAPGARGDITVPYTTNGYSTLGVYQRVQPRLYATPTVDDTRDPGARPNFNQYSYYGASKQFSGATEGAAPRRTPIPGQR